MYAMVKLTMYLFRVYSDFRENMLSAKLVFALGHCPTETAVSFVCLFVLLLICLEEIHCRLYADITVHLS